MFIDPVHPGLQPAHGNGVDGGFHPYGNPNGLPPGIGNPALPPASHIGIGPNGLPVAIPPNPAPVPVPVPGGPFGTGPAGPSLASFLTGVPNPSGGNPSGVTAPPPAPSTNPNGGGGGAPAPAGGPSQDEHNISLVSEHLLSALQASKDPQLKESLSTALAAIHKHLSGMQKERHAALQGKISPRFLEQTYGPAHQLAQQGHYAQAAQTWIQHHPLAVSHGRIPGYVQQWEAQAHTSAPAPGATAQ